MMIEKYYLIVGIFVVLIGFLGISIRKNLITVLVSTEIMLNGANIVLVAASKMTNVPDTQILALMVLTVAASEVAIGLGLIVSLFKLKGYEASEEIKELRDR